jgi:hypothetical protein
MATSTSLNPPLAACTNERALRGAPCSGMTTLSPAGGPYVKTTAKILKNGLAAAVEQNRKLFVASNFERSAPTTKKLCLPNFSGECAAVRLIGRLLVVELRMDLGVRQLLFIMAAAVATVVVLMGQPL